MANLIETAAIEAKKVYTGKEACIQCGRPKSAMQGTVHNGWCWWCIENKVLGRGYDSYGRTLVYIDGRCRSYEPDKPSKPATYSTTAKVPQCPHYTSDQGCPLHGELCAS